MSMWYDEREPCDFYDDELPTGYVKIDDIPDLDSIKRHVEALFDAVYSTGDVIAIEDHLDEICAYLSVKKMSSQPAKIEKAK